MTMLRIAALAVIAAVAAPVAAQDLFASNPGSLVKTLRDMGYRATLGQTADGDPKIDSAISGSDYTIFFYGCTDHIDCTSLQFSAGWTILGGVSADIINNWNFNKLSGKAALDADSDPWLTYFVTLEGGINRQNFEDVVAWWDVAVTEFTQTIGY